MRLWTSCEIGGTAARTKPAMTSTKPEVTITTVSPRASPRPMRKSTIGFRPMAMNSASPMMTRTLRDIGDPPGDDVGDGHAQGRRQPDEERGPPIEGAPEDTE